MHALDWIVLITTLAAIVGYGVFKTRRRGAGELLSGSKDVSLWTIGLGIMATQASAITFLSTPGQAYAEDMGFIQFYFGLPLAVILVSIFFVPAYRKMSAVTAYQFLEQRFDRKTRLFTAALFLMSRGLAAGITIFAPAIVLSAALGVSLNLMIVIIGLIVVFYTVSGGSAAVAVTQKWQMLTILGGMGIAAYLLVDKIPVSLPQAYDIAGRMGKLNIINTSLDPGTRYTLWSGLAGGLFLSLSYLGTDQSQVQRYLGAENQSTSRFGLLFNGVFKVPMQFSILAIGVLLFVFYQFTQPPIFFNESEVKRAPVEVQAELADLQRFHENSFAAKRQALLIGDWAAVNANKETLALVREQYMDLLEEHVPNFQRKDTDYVFITFVLNFLPKGLVGLLLAVIISAAMSSTAGEVSALATTTYVDYYTVFKGESQRPKRTIRTLTFVWGIAAIGVALAAPLYENLIQLVNVLGSLFYGTILGIFLVALFMKHIGGKSIFIAGIVGQFVVFLVHYLNTADLISLGFLWYNVIGSTVVVCIANILHFGLKQQELSS
ncbi:sodium:solute symporter [Schleiferiaceae bacterium]|nr:sodium:solute symporter [Schleiferiaceae bacterium]MDB4125030.1 sodium:solute symporter [Schleiferiaceae bacterium]MDB4176885.1 sodium:solute symporter [Schleiferiaceae bacterium]MDC1224970.1 sodium:solute symporter [Schleiferiaceae bacterium]MDC1363696.1 sodium:solute symporter [Schleiferiaceae bacterium]